jgi:hypothetical protein
MELTVGEIAKLNLKITKMDVFKEFKVIKIDKP